MDLAQTQLILTTRPRGASLNTIGDQPSTVFSNPVPVSIVDNQTVTSQITVSGVAPAVIETTVITWIRHPFPATLNVTLTSPQGTVVTISTGSGDGAQDTFNGTYWQDKPDSGSTPTPVTDGSFAAFVTETPLVPEEAMAAFDGEDPNGVWTLTITDTAAVLEGTLDNWALIFREISCPTAFEVTKTAASAVLAGTSLVYTITVNNLGPHEVRNATLTDPLPPNTTFQSLAPPAGWACTTPAVGANGTVSCTKPDVALSEGGVFTLTVLVDAATPAGTILSNAVSYSADNPGGFTAPAANTTVINLPTVAIAVPTTGAATTATSPFLDVSGTSTPPPSLRAIAGPDPGQAATITSVTWANDRGGSGTATGTTAWSIRAVPLQAGTNVVTVTATDSNGASSTDTLTVTVSEFLYYLAEGATGPLFDFDLLLGNPNGVPAPVTISFLREVGAPVVVTETLAANSRRTLRVNDVPGLATAAISTVVASTAALPLSVERSMLWDASVPAPRPADGGTIAAGATYYGGHTAKAVDSPRTTWFFAEGSQGFFATFLLLANANATPTDATVTYLVEGGSPVVQNVTVGATARLTLFAGSLPALAGKSFGITVTAIQPIIAERAMYFTAGRFWEGGHESAGVPEASTSWFHAEGATGPFFTTFILVSNPNGVVADLTVTYLLESGTTVVRAYSVPANGRITINVGTQDAALANAAVSTTVTATVPVVSERAMYWQGGFATWYEAHNAFGVTATGPKWGLAEGRVGTTFGYETYILLANPAATAANVRITYLRTTGAPVVKTYTVPATSRFNVFVNGMVPELVDESFAALIEVTNGVAIAVERALYWNDGGQTWGGGTNATAVRLP